MHVMMVNLATVLLSTALIVYAGDGNLLPNDNTITQDYKYDVLDIMNNHFDLSLDYLYTGVQYDSQYGERPGLAKKLRGMSDAQWEAGMEALNKYLEHGGSTDDKFIGKLDFNGEVTCNLDYSNKGDIYLDTLKTLQTNSADTLESYTGQYVRAKNNNDGDIVHYLEEKIEKEVKNIHELKGHITTLTAMKSIGAAVAAFDSNL